MRFSLLRSVGAAGVGLLANSGSGHASSVLGDPDAVVPSNVDFHLDQAQGHHVLQEDMLCRYVIVLDNAAPRHQCIIEGVTYEIEGAGDSWYTDLMSGFDHITIPSGSVVNEGSWTIDVNGNDPIVAMTPLDGSGNSVRRRSLTVAGGDREALYVRVSHTNMDPLSTTAEQLSRSTFGTALYQDATGFNVHNALWDCSHEKLNIQPASDRPRTNNPTNPTSTVGDIENGVVEVEVATYCPKRGLCDNAVRNEAEVALKDAFGVSSVEDLADHVLYCVPNATYSLVAYGALNDHYTVYNDEYCSDAFTIAHELGHNFGLAHSNENNVEYADHTGLMGNGGIGSGATAEPLCFNTVKNWQLGWMPEAQHTIKLDDGYIGKLKGQVHYQPGDQEQDPIMIQIDQAGEASALNYYVGFNHAVSFNRGTHEAQNQVTVHAWSGPEQGYHASHLVAKLDAGDNNEWFKTMSDGVVAKVKVLDIDDSSSGGHAEVRVTYGNFRCTSNDECVSNTGSCFRGSCFDPDEDGEGTCEYEPIPDCCGNDICEGDEVLNCREDCPPTELFTTDVTEAGITHVGSVFDITARYDIEIVGFKARNFYEMYGLVTVFARSGSHTNEDDVRWWNPVLTGRSPNTYFRGRYEDYVIMLDTPVIVRAGETHAFLVHSGGGMMFETYWLGAGGESPAISNDDLVTDNWKVCDSLGSSSGCHYSEISVQEEVMTGGILYYNIHSDLDWVCPHGSIPLGTHNGCCESSCGSYCAASDCASGTGQCCPESNCYYESVVPCYYPDPTSSPTGAPSDTPSESIVPSGSPSGSPSECPATCGQWGPPNTLCTARLNGSPIYPDETWGARAGEPGLTREECHAACEAEQVRVGSNEGCCQSDDHRCDWYSVAGTRPQAYYWWMTVRTATDCMCTPLNGEDTDGGAEVPDPVTPHLMGGGFCADSRGRGFSCLTLEDSINNIDVCAHSCADLVLGQVVPGALVGFELHNHNGKCVCRFDDPLDCNRDYSGAHGCWNPGTASEGPVTRTRPAWNFKCYQMAVDQPAPGLEEEAAGTGEGESALANFVHSMRDIVAQGKKRAEEVRPVLVPVSHSKEKAEEVPPSAKKDANTDEGTGSLTPHQSEEAPGVGESKSTLENVLNLLKDEAFHRNGEVEEFLPTG